MGYMKALLFALVLLWPSTPLGQPTGRLIHFVCGSQSAATEVGYMERDGNLVYGITPLPSDCQWTMYWGGDFYDRIGTVVEIVDVIPDAHPQYGDAYVGRVLLRGNTYYSAGFIFSG